MKKLTELLHPDERMRLIYSISAVGAILLIAMLLPLAFRSDPEALPEQSGAVTDKAALFAQFWNDAGEGVSAEKQESVSAERSRFCEQFMRDLIGRCIDDAGLERPEPSGSEYTLLRDGSGGELNLCRMWLEARGDWQNWLDVCFDSESGELYYFYLSREALNGDPDANAALSGLTAESLAAALAEESGWTLRHVGSGADGSVLAVFGSENGSRCFEIACRVSGTLADIRLCCK